MIAAARACFRLNRRSRGGGGGGATNRGMEWPTCLYVCVEREGGGESERGERERERQGERERPLSKKREVYLATEMAH